MPVSFTQKGYYEVWRDGQKISQHNREREATETITEHSAIHGDGDYEIRPPLVMAKAYGVVSNQDGGDTTPPTTPGSVSASATSATTGTVTWTASTDNVGVAGYQVFVDGSPVDTTTSLSYGLTGLSPSTQYSVTVTAYDAAGNNSPAGGPSLFTTDANSAPVWSLGNQAYETGDAVSIDLDANCTDADGDTITYSLVSGTLPSGLTLSGARNQTISGSVDTVETANFTLGASDGIAATQEVALTFTITEPDITAPAAPTGLSVVSTTSSSISLDWNDNAESDLASYTIYRSTDGVSFGVRQSGVLVSNFTDSGLNASTTYYYYVTATDDSDNESAVSSTVSDTTSAVASNNGTRINAILDNYTLPAAWSGSLLYPADPITTKEITVNSAADFNLYAGQSAPGGAGGWLITIGSSFNGNLSIAADDIDVVMDNSFTIVGDLTMDTGSRVSRVRWTGGNIGAGNAQSWRPVSDVLFDDVVFFGRIDLDSRPDPIGSTHRVAFINSDITTVGSTSGEDIDFTFETVSRTSAGRHSDIILGNCKVLNQNNSPTRFGYAERVVAVESYCWTDDGSFPTGATGFRFSSGSQNAFVAGRSGKPFVMVERQHLNYILSGTGSTCITNGTYDNIEFYSQGNFFGLHFSVPNTGTVSNVEWFSNIGAGETLSISPFTDGGGIQTSQAWDGLASSLRSSAAYGAQR